MMRQCTQAKVEGLCRKVTSIKLEKCIWTRWLKDLKVMNHPKFLLPMHMTRRKKGRKEGRRKRKIHIKKKEKKEKHISIDIQIYTHALTYTCVSALYFIKRLYVPSTKRSRP